jgi:hypothetical protein
MLIEPSFLFCASIVVVKIRAHFEKLKKRPDALVRNFRRRSDDINTGVLFF